MILMVFTILIIGFLLGLYFANPLFVDDFNEEFDEDFVRDYIDELFSNDNGETSISIAINYGYNAGQIDLVNQDHPTNEIEAQLKAVELISNYEDYLNNLIGYFEQ